MSGLVLARRVKSEQATRHIIAIATSAWDEAGLATDAIDSGCIAFVPKPIELDTLLAILRATLVQAASSASEAGTGGIRESTRGRGPSLRYTRCTCSSTPRAARPATTDRRSDHLATPPPNDGLLEALNSLSRQVDLHEEVFRVDGANRSRHRQR